MRRGSRPAPGRRWLTSEHPRVARPRVRVARRGTRPMSGHRRRAAERSTGAGPPSPRGGAPERRPAPPARRRTGPATRHQPHAPERPSGASPPACRVGRTRDGAADGPPPRRQPRASASRAASGKAFIVSPAETGSTRKRRRRSADAGRDRPPAGRAARLVRHGARRPRTRADAPTTRGTGEAPPARTTGRAVPAEARCQPPRDTARRRSTARRTVRERAGVRGANVAERLREGNALADALAGPASLRRRRKGPIAAARGSTAAGPRRDPRTAGTRVPRKTTQG